MSDDGAIHSTRSLLEDLRELGLKGGDTVIAHSSLKAIGRVITAAENHAPVNVAQE